MKHVRWLLALVGLCVAAGDVSAQGYIAAPFGPYGYGGISIGGSFGRGRLRGSFAYSSGFLAGPYGYAPYGIYPGYSQVNIYQAVTPPPAVVIVPPPVVIDPTNLAGVGRLRLDEPPPPLPPPVDRKRPQPPEQLPLPNPDLPKPKGDQPKPDQPKPPDRPPPAPPRPPIPDPNPKAEYARQLAEGQQAFANEEYGRAAFRFERAVQADPQEALGHFLLAQALFTLGKYREAADEIHAGMRLQPDWPTAGYRPLQLYGLNVADYPEDLQRLEATLARHPQDPVLLFLSGYFLWFDGRKEEAWPLFERAAPLAPDRSFIDRFLQAMPGPHVV